MVTVISALVVFGILVLVHELGHFVMAKRTGMFVKEFAIGFGPKLISRKIGETVYSIRCIPLGGFNDIAGMDPGDDEAGERSYFRKPIAHRMVVIVAGAAMNLILPIFLFWGMIYFNGVASPSPEPVLGEVVANTPAAKAGLKDGDRIVKMDDKVINSWQDFTDVVRDGAGHSYRVVLERDGKQQETVLTPEYNEQAKRAMVGVRSDVIIEKAGIGEAFSMALSRNMLIIRRMIEGIGDIIFGEAAGEVSGPIGVIQMTGEMAEAGMLPLINFAALLSLNLGIVNLLPIPALDGGHFVMLLLEAVRGKPLGEKALGNIQMIGIACLLTIMLFATKNDIVRIFFK